MTRRWFALQVYSGRERWVATQLARSNHEVLLPLAKKVSQWSDRTKVLYAPLFPGYLFCHFDPEERSALWGSTGILRVVGVGDEPEAIPDDEIASLQRVVDSGLLLEPWPYLAGGTQIQIVGGALDGVTGTFIEAKNKRRIVVSVTLLQRSVSVELDREYAVPVRLDLPAASRQANQLVS